MLYDIGWRFRICTLKGTVHSDRNLQCCLIKMPILTPSSVVQKLMFFTAAMVFLPLVTFFTCQYLFESSLVSGGSAALAANLVLISYIVVAFAEDTGSDSETESKKDQ